jgi:hypothetical protein
MASRCPLKVAHQAQNDGWTGAMEKLGKLLPGLPRFVQRAEKILW